VGIELAYTSLDTVRGAFLLFYKGVSMSKREVEVVESVVRGFIKGGVTPKELFVGIHNAFFKGELLEECNIGCTDKQFTEMFGHFEALTKIAKKLN